MTANVRSRSASRLVAVLLLAASPAAIAEGNAEFTPPSTDEIMSSGRAGVVGITVDHDFKIVSAVLPEGPAAYAGVRVGDHIIAVDGYPTAKMHNLKEFAKRVSGGVGSEIDMELRHRDSGRPFHIRVRRVPAIPPPSQIPPGFDAHQVRTNKRPNQAMKRIATV
jgi:S1-C subfamily serine protease